MIYENLIAEYGLLDNEVIIELENDDLDKTSQSEPVNPKDEQNVTW